MKSNQSQISWLHWPDGRRAETWSPFIGCSPVGEGCRNCWARREEDTRFRHLGRCGKDWNGKSYSFNTGPMFQGDEALAKPLRWREPRTVFVCPRSDLFHEGVSDGQIRAVWEVMLDTPRHRYVVLTKRPGRMKDVLRRPMAPTLPNVILGVSAWDQASADKMIPDLLATPAACRAVSLEPLLGPVDLWDYIHDLPTDGIPARLDWVIVGGESAKPRRNARPMHPDWVCEVRDDCEAAGVPWYLKQWGEWDHRGELVGTKASGRRLDGLEYLQFPEGV